MSIPSEIRSLLEYARRLGLEVQPARNKHRLWLLINPRTGAQGFLPRKVEGKGQAYRNYRHQIERLAEGICLKSAGT